NTGGRFARLPLCWHSVAMAIELTPMPVSEMPAWLDAIKAEYVESRRLAGESREEAQSNADASFARFFPDGLPIDGHLVFQAHHETEDDSVGYLWIGPQMDSSPDKWWVWDIEIYKPHQRNGYGRETMLLAERTAKACGASELGLNVFGYNTSARALYESLGYEPTSIRMAKAL
ncbi:GNAT family N-acetyltransferase, partial [Paeniglutamicibacter sp. R2-26]|uniref:GNAT family N-acetyltransferase n=1 Tax=Paeniglutamicibacter sp. R2-26 TaxID=3144417 RepID=UPI003EE4B91C